MTDDPMLSLLLSDDEEYRFAEERRLFYVAMTRAKTNLQISYSSTDMKGKEIESSMFVGELLSTSNLKPEKITVSDASTLDFFALNFVGSSYLIADNKISSRFKYTNLVAGLCTLSVTFYIFLVLFFSWWVITV